MPKFSIIVPVYNTEEKYLRDCFESITKQTFADFEVVIINDGSDKEATLKVLDEYTRKDKRFKKYDSETNRGVGMSRYIGIKQACGEYTIFVDSDDSINLKLLAQVLPHADGSIELIRYKTTDPTYNTRINIKEFKTGEEAIKLWCKEPYIRHFMYTMYCFKTDLLKRQRSYPTLIRVYEDVAKIPIIICSAQSVHTIDYIGYNKINRKKRVKNEYDINEKKQSFKTATDYCIRRLKELKISEETKKIIEIDYKRRMCLLNNKLKKQ